MKFAISRLAQLELDETQEYYNTQKNELGDEFYELARQTIDMVFQSPLHYPVVVKPVHKVVMKRFPYSIFYRFDDDATVILSISHQHRKPFYIY